jgi:penicillin-binding protein 1C
LSAHAEGDVREIYWFVDDAFAARSAPGAEIPWIPKRAGRYRVRAVDDHGRATLRDVEVTLVM